jgi:hypothetical protein
MLFVRTTSRSCRRTNQSRSTCRLTWTSIILNVVTVRHYCLVRRTNDSLRVRRVETDGNVQSMFRMINGWQSERNVFVDNINTNTTHSRNTFDNNRRRAFDSTDKRTCKSIDELLTIETKDSLVIIVTRVRVFTVTTIMLNTPIIVRRTH